MIKAAYCGQSTGSGQTGSLLSSLIRKDTTTTSCNEHVILMRERIERNEEPEL